MRRAKTPSKQLNSEAIRGATLCYMSPVIAGQCSKMCLQCQRKGPSKILEFHMQEAGYLRQSHFRFVFSRHLPKITLYQSYTIVKKRFCSIFTAIPNTAFFFSAISTQEKKKGSINEESEDSEEEHDQSPVPSTFSQQWLNENPTLVNKSLWPAITYWLALTTPIVNLGTGYETLEISKARTMKSQ